VPGNWILGYLDSGIADSGSARVAEMALVGLVGLATSSFFMVFSRFSWDVIMQILNSAFRAASYICSP